MNQLDSFVSNVGIPGTPQPPLTNFRSPTKSNLKRRLIDCMEDAPSPKRSNTDESMKKKRNIQFDAVTVYYFPRAQGFTCVPSQVHTFFTIQTLFLFVYITNNILVLHCFNNM